MNRIKRSTKATKVAKDKAVKAKFSFKRTILPPLAGILVMVAVISLFNLQIIQAQWQYHQAQKTVASASSNVASTVKTDAVVNDTKSPNPSKDPLLTIPAIGTEAPIVFEPSFAEWKVQLALREGVVHYGTTANPGENGNVVVLGHSSGQAWAPGNYKFVFTLLNKLQPGDKIYLDYDGTRYTYEVTGSVVVKPNDASEIQPTSTPTLSLVTCTPVGTSLNRLIVHAKQISPSPTKPANTTASDATAAQAEVKTAAVPSIPQELPSSASASLWQRFLDLF